MEASIANVLLRPQLLGRRPTDDEALALDMLTNLGSRLLADFLQGGPASQKIAAAAQAGATDFIAQFQPRLPVTRTKLLDWFKPYLSKVEGIANQLGHEPAENISAVITSLVTLCNQLLDDLHSTQIADRLNALADILENDLGVSWDTFEVFFEDIFDRVTNALSADFLQGIQTESALNNFMISRQLLGLRRVAKAQAAAMPLPTFNRRALIRDLQLQMTASNWDKTLDAISEKLNSLPDKIEEILPLITQSFIPSTSRKSVRAAGDDDAKQYSWYASWFRGEGTEVRDRFDLPTEPCASEMHFSSADYADFLEIWAGVTAAFEEAGRAVKYALDADTGNQYSPWFNFGWQAGMSIMTALSYSVNGKEWVDFYKVKGHPAFQKGAPQAITLATSFEEFPGAWGWLWATWPHDRNNTSAGMAGATVSPGLMGMPWAAAWLAREFSLSLFTLISNIGSDSEATKNHEKIGGITKVFRKSGAYLAALLIDRKEWYFSIGRDNFGLSVLVLLGGGVITWAAELLGWLTAGALALHISDRYWKFEGENAGDVFSEFFGGENAYGSFFLSFVEFYNTWSAFWEGDADGGKFGSKAVPQLDGTLKYQETTFAGYPPKATSPYRLPFGPGRLVFCCQGHNGFSTHHFSKGLIYAVDFLLKEGELVLAMRGGTVVEYWDDFPDDSSAGLNYIVIRHDDKNSDHDRGENGQVVTTLSRYENSRQFGVRDAFATIGITEDRIVNSVVEQGFPIMFLGKRTGLLNFDYLQVQVSADPTNALFPTTIPFVFGDIPDDGVPLMGKYYQSTNKLNKFARYHADSFSGTVMGGGTLGSNYIELNAPLPEPEISYINRFVVVSRAGKIIQYKKTTGYINPDKRLTIEGVWEKDLQVGDAYRIGAPIYSAASEEEKMEAYLSPDTYSGQYSPCDFPDGTLAYTYLKHKTW